MQDTCVANAIATRFFYYYYYYDDDDDLQYIIICPYFYNLFLFF